MAIPSEEFFTAFGAITFHYANVEYGIKATLSDMLDIHIFDIMVMAEPYNALSLRNVATSLTKESTLTAEEKAAFLSIVEEFGKLAPIRNTVGHSRWKEGRRPRSIKPVGISIRSGTAKLIGSNDDERDYTSAELMAEADRLRDLNRVLAFWHSSAGMQGLREKRQGSDEA